MISAGRVRVETQENTELFASSLFLIIIDEFLVRRCVFTVSSGPSIDTITRFFIFIFFVCVTPCLSPFSFLQFTCLIKDPFI